MISMESPPPPLPRAYLGTSSMNEEWKAANPLTARMFRRYEICWIILCDIRRARLFVVDERESLKNFAFPPHVSSSSLMIIKLVRLEPEAKQILSCFFHLFFPTRRQSESEQSETCQLEFISVVKDDKVWRWEESTYDKGKQTHNKRRSERDGLKVLCES